MTLTHGARFGEFDLNSEFVTPLPTTDLMSLPGLPTATGVYDFFLEEEASPCSSSLKQSRTIPVLGQ